MAKRKTGKLNKIEKFYIENNRDKAANDLAGDLNRTVSCVAKYISEELGGDVSTEEEVSGTVGELMGRKEERGVTIMTPNASQVSDETRSDRLSTNDSRVDRESIYIINKNK